jgi:hypothetical protein
MKPQSLQRKYRTSYFPSTVAVPKDEALAWQTLQFMLVSLS